MVSHTLKDCSLYKILLPVVLKNSPMCLLMNSCCNYTGYLFSPGLSSSLHHLHALTTRYPTYLRTLLNCYTPQHTLQSVISIFFSSRGFLLSLPRGRSVTLRLKFETTYPLTSAFPIPSPSLNAVLKRTYFNSFLVSLLPSSPPRDCLHLRFNLPSVL